MVLVASGRSAFILSQQVYLCGLLTELSLFLRTQFVRYREKMMGEITTLNFSVALSV